MTITIMDEIAKDITITKTTTKEMTNVEKTYNIQTGQTDKMNHIINKIGTKIRITIKIGDD